MREIFCYPRKNHNFNLTTEDLLSILLKTNL
ncbi:MAG: hypothetical protein MRECE_3c042 [Mycoplasmataceae bacterium CE_OT135]|nr:MAG: hypothetical protein MRECE_3c042 [Mycoplasmataceae bacterium CE_OT135]